jgi:hypothetical protein
MARGTLKVGRIVPILFGAFKGRFGLFRTACTLLKIDKNFKINHPSVQWREINSIAPTIGESPAYKVFSKLLSLERKEDQLGPWSN